MEEREAKVQPEIETVSQQIDESVAQMEQQMVKTLNEWNEEQNRITLALRSVNQKILQSSVHLDNSVVDDLKKPELVFQNLISELMGVVHRWRLASVQKGDVNDKMAKSLLNYLIKCFKSTGTPVEKLESIGSAFDEKLMIQAGKVEVEDRSQDGVVCASLTPGLKVRDQILCRELVLCGVYEESREKPEPECIHPSEGETGQTDGKEADTV